MGFGKRVLDCGLPEMDDTEHFLDFFGSESGFWVYSEGEVLVIEGYLHVPLKIV